MKPGQTNSENKFQKYPLVIMTGLSLFFLLAEVYARLWRKRLGKCYELTVIEILSYVVGIQTILHDISRLSKKKFHKLIKLSTK